MEYYLVIKWKEVLLHANPGYFAYEETEVQRGLKNIHPG